MYAPITFPANEPTDEPLEVEVAENGSPTVLLMAGFAWAGKVSSVLLVSSGSSTSRAAAALSAASSAMAVTEVVAADASLLAEVMPEIAAGAAEIRI